MKSILQITVEREVPGDAMEWSKDKISTFIRDSMGISGPVRYAFMKQGDLCFKVIIGGRGMARKWEPEKIAKSIYDSFIFYAEEGIGEEYRDKDGFKKYPEGTNTMRVLGPKNETFVADTYFL